MSERSRPSGRKFEDVKLGFAVSVLSNAINDRSSNIDTLEAGSTERVKTVAEIAALTEKRSQLFLEAEGISPEKARELAAELIYEGMLVLDYATAERLPIPELRDRMDRGIHAFDFDTLVEGLDSAAFIGYSPPAQH